MFPAGGAIDAKVSRRMRSDWNRRAWFDPRYYVALGRSNQSWEEFLGGADDLALGLQKELPRIASATAPAARRALEIGCGPGRLMLPLSRHFHEIHGVDVSPRMVRLARQNLAGISRAHVCTADGISLSNFEDDSFDFVYSYAVFQHIPSRDVVFNYLRETRRVLRSGGVARLQFNGLQEGAEQSDTWIGGWAASR
jgi:SAM-dependent methyltransferase